jgi:hypothetical protein
MAARTLLVAALSVLAMVGVATVAVAPASAAQAKPSARIEDGALAACIKQQQRADGRPVSTVARTSDLAKLTRLHCRLTWDIHAEGIYDFSQLRYGVRLRSLSFFTEVPYPYADYSPIDRLQHLETLKINRTRCHLPLSAHDGRCV